ncbi:MAG: rRNA maturation RNase YbeY [Candidatus Omnitrophica bacterium]|jgi:rRNA maturation RNase YbeY|nr:rRNA maturation RNase YbeY [Candidatus Omnitrophota bacterium]
MARTRTARRSRGAAAFTEKTRIPFTRRAAALYAQKTLAALGRKDCRINILFVGDPAMRRLNGRFKHRKGPTDVLAFDTGDIAISVDTARKNAKRFGNTLAVELRLYIIHGILHLCGYDDTSAPAAKEMRRMETSIMGRL